MRPVHIVSTAEFLINNANAEIQVIDAKTREVLNDVQAIEIVISIDDGMWARLTRVRMRDNLHCEVDADENLIEYKEDVLVTSVHIG
jgi:hypothetical protein